MLDNDRLVNVIRELDRNDARVIVITAWACSPLHVCDLFRDFTNAQIVVFFQVLSYDSFYADFKSTADPCIESIDRLEQLCKRKYKEYLQEAVKERAPSIKFYNYSINKRDMPFQLHAKTITVLYSNSVRYVQFSWNLDDRHLDKRSLVYSGVPCNLRAWTAVLASDDFWKQNKVACATAAGTDLDGRALCKQVDTFVARGGLREDPAVELTVTLPQTYAGHKTMRAVALETLNRYRTLGDYVSRFKEYTSDPVPSRLVVLTNYMSERMVTAACGTIGAVFTLPANDDPSPEITTAYPKGFENNVNDIHEKFVYKMTVDDQEILWMFFCSHNLTPASWRVGARGGHEERKGGDSDSDSDDDTNTVNPQEGKNLEVGVFAFPSISQKPWTNLVEDKLQKYYSRDKLNKLTSTNHRCQNLQRAPEAEADAPSFRMDRGAPRRFEAPPAQIECHSLAGDAWSRYKDRKNCLLSSLLVNVGGLTDLLMHPQFREDNFTRYALYDYVFHDIAGGLTWVKGGAYQSKQLLGLIAKQTRGADWNEKSRSPDLVVATLADVFVTWGRTFEMFHKEIPVDRPRVSRETLIDYVNIYSANVPDAQAPNQKPAMFVDPKRLRSTLDKKPKKMVETYDSLSFLVQNMFTEREVWWTCPAQGHDFYWSVSKMFETPHCPVCQSSPAVQSIYSTVRALGYKNVTVELPVFKRESVSQQERLTKSYNGKGQAFLSIHGVLDPSKVNVNDQGALCKDVLVKGGLLQNMAYDVFCVLETPQGYQYVAFEADDPSHRSRVKKGNDRVPLTNVPKARDIHNQDAVKNVVSWLMNVHVVRISTADSNFNATALIPGIVTECMRWLKDRLCWCPVFEDLVSLHDHVKTTVEALDDRQKHANDIRNPLIDERTKQLRFESTKPLSILFDIQDKRLNPSNNVQVYLDTNRLHAVYDDRKPVVICNYVDYFSLFYNLLNMERFRKSRQVDAAERFYEIDTDTGIGTLFDSKELGGSHMVTRMSDVGEVCSVDLEYLHTWEMEEEIHPQRAWTSVRDGVSFVRLLRNFQEPTAQQKSVFRAPQWTRQDALEPFIKAGKKIWLLDAVGSKEGKAVKVKRIGVENGMFVLETDRERIDPYYIRHRVYNATTQGTRGRRRSGYLPIPNVNLQPEVPKVPRQPARGRPVPPAPAPAPKTSTTRGRNKLESWLKTGAEVTVLSEGGGANEVRTLTRVATDLDGQWWLYYTGRGKKICAIAPQDIRRLVKGPKGERSSYEPTVIDVRAKSGCASPLRKSSSRKR
jgi:hypothetical protein